MTRVIGPCEWCGDPAYSRIPTGTGHGAACPRCRASLAETSLDQREATRRQTTIDGALNQAPDSNPNNALYGSEAA